MNKKKNFLLERFDRFSKSLVEILVGFVRVYQKALSPLFKPSCRYLPTCSEYTIQALRTWGPVRGALLGGWRILRCHPLARQRVDEVPIRKSIPDSNSKNYH